MLQFTTDNSFRCGTVQELIWHTAAKNTGYEYQFSRTVHGQEALAHLMLLKFHLSSARLPLWQQMRKYNESDQQLRAADARHTGPTLAQKTGGIQRRKSWGEVAKFDPTRPPILWISPIAGPGGRKPAAAQAWICCIENKAPSAISADGWN